MASVVDSDKIWQFFNKNAKFKTIYSFIKKNSLKSLFLVIISSLTHLQNGNTKIKFMLIILEKIHVGSEKIRIRNYLKSRIRTGIRKKLFRIQNNDYGKWLDEDPGNQLKRKLIMGKQCCGSWFLPISDPGSKKKKKERGEKKFVVIPFFVATNLTKLKNAEENNSGQFSKNYRTFT
jgi:hypothetical protein